MGDLLPRRALLIVTTWWSGPAKLAVSLARHRLGSSRQSTRWDHPCNFVKSIRRIHTYRPINSLTSLLEAVSTSHPTLLVPCDDGAVWELHELYESRPALRPLIERSLGDAEAYPVLASRAKLADEARSLGIRVSQTITVTETRDLHDWFTDERPAVVLKRDGTFGGKGVCMVRSLAQAESALAKLARFTNYLGAALRWLAVRDPLSFMAVGLPSPVVLQEMIQGQPANILFVSNEGKVLASVTVEVLATEGLTGAALAVRVIENLEIQLAAEKIAASLKLSGFHGLDFMLETGTGSAFLIEMNPRCTQLGHLVVKGQGDLTGFLGRSTAPGRPAVRDGSSDEIVVFFPQGLWSLREPLPGHRVHVDIPWAKPRLVQELMRRDWRERHWLGRMYYQLRPNKRAAVSWPSEPQAEDTPSRVSARHLDRTAEL